MRLYLDATTLISLGSTGRLDLLTSFDATPTVPPAVQEEVTTQPARANLQRFLARHETAASRHDEHLQRALDVLGDEGVTGDAQIVAGVLAAREAGADVGVVSDDQRVRTVARGFDATVTGTLGVVLGATADGRLDGDAAKDVVRELDSRGLHTTAELRERAFELVDAAADGG